MTVYPFPDNQDATGTAYEGLAGFDASKNILLAHFDEDPGNPIIESAQGLSVDESTWVTGAGTITKGTAGVTPGSKSIKLDNRGGFSFAASHEVLPANDEFTMCYWSYQEAAVWPPGFHIPFSRGYSLGLTSTTYVAYGRDNNPPNVAGRRANVQWGNIPSPALVQTWIWNVVHWGNNGGVSECKHWTHVGLTDTVGTANTTLSGAPLLDFVTEFGTPNLYTSPWLFGREYGLGPALPVTERFSEFALFEGPAWSDATRQGVYDRQVGIFNPPPVEDPVVPEKPFLCYNAGMPTEAKWTTNGAYSSTDQADTSAPGYLALDNVASRPTFPNAPLAIWYLNVGGPSTDPYPVDVLAIVGHNFPESVISIAVEIADDADFTSGVETIKQWLVTVSSPNVRLVHVLPEQKEFQFARIILSGFGTVVPYLAEFFAYALIGLDHSFDIPTDDQKVESKLGEFMSDSGHRSVVVRRLNVASRNYQFTLQGSAQYQKFLDLYDASQGGTVPIGEVDDLTTPTRFYVWNVSQSRDAPLVEYDTRKAVLSLAEMAPFVEDEP